MGFQLDAAILPAKQVNLNADKAEVVNRSQSSQSQEPSDFHKILGKENNRSQDHSSRADAHDDIPAKDSSSVQPKEQALEGDEFSQHEVNVDADVNEASIIDSVRLSGENQVSEEIADEIPVDKSALSFFDDTVDETDTLDFVFNRLGFLSNEPVLQSKDQQHITRSFSLDGNVEESKKSLSFLIDEGLTGDVSGIDSVDEVAAQLGTEMKKTVLASGVSLASVLDNRAKNNVPAVGIQEVVEEKVFTKGILGESTGVNSVTSSSGVSNSVTPHSSLLPNDKSGSLFDTLLSGKSGTNNNALMPAENLLTNTVQESLIGSQKIADDSIPTTLISKLGLPDALMSPVNGRVQIPVNVTFGQPQWANAIADRTAMLASQNINFAELQLDPPELGPLTVKIHIQQDQATVNFVAHSSLIKDSLEQSSQRLKDMFNEQGLNLADVDVSERQSDSQDNAKNSDHENADTLGHDDVDLEGDSNSIVVNHQININNGVDDFA